MKKIYKSSILLIGIIILFLLYFARQIPLFIHYDEPKESFDQSAPKNAELLNILQYEDIAMIIYRSKDNPASYDLIAQTQNGWSSMKKDFFSKSDTFVCNGTGLATLRKINKKYVVTLWFPSEKDCIVSDSAGTSWQKTSVPYGNGAMHFALGVIQTDDFKDYHIKIDDQEYSF